MTDRQTIGEPDPFRLRHRMNLRVIVDMIVRNRMGKEQAKAHVKSWVQEHVQAEERERFRQLAEDELLGLHEGNFARYKITKAEFASWQEVWSGPAA